MAKSKVGLQKEISSIFTGVQIPKANPAEEVLAGTPSGPAQYVPPKPIPTSTRNPFAAREHRDYNSSPGHAACDESAKLADAKQAKSETTPKTRRQIPWLQIWQKIQGKLLSPKHGANLSKQKAMVLLGPVLLVVFIVILTQVLRKPSGAAPKPTKTFAPSGVTPAFTGKIAWQIPAPYPTNLRDPMAFGSVRIEPKDGNVSSLVVKGIVFSDDRPAAVIGNDIVFEGDTVGGATVLKINEDSVEFQMNDKKWTQKVNR